MNLQLKKKRCVVTGASQGLGRAIATILASEECELLLVARRKKPLQDTAKLIEKKYKTKVFILSLDVTSKNADVKIKNFALSKLGSIDILINSAGGSRPTTWDAPESFWEEGMNLNFTRSEERRVGNECRYRESRSQEQREHCYYTSINNS